MHAANARFSNPEDIERRIIAKIIEKNKFAKGGSFLTWTVKAKAVGLNRHETLQKSLKGEPGSRGWFEKILIELGIPQDEWGKHLVEVCDSEQNEKEANEKTPTQSSQETLENAMSPTGTMNPSEDILPLPVEITEPPIDMFGDTISVSDPKRQIPRVFAVLGASAIFCVSFIYPPTYTFAKSKPLSKKPTLNIMHHIKENESDPNFLCETLLFTLNGVLDSDEVVAQVSRDEEFNDVISESRITEKSATETSLRKEKKDLNGCWVRLVARSSLDKTEHFSNKIQVK